MDLVDELEKKWRNIYRWSKNSSFNYYTWERKKKIEILFQKLIIITIKQQTKHQQQCPQQCPQQHIQQFLDIINIDALCYINNHTIIHQSMVKWSKLRKHNVVYQLFFISIL